MPTLGLWPSCNQFPQLPQEVIRFSIINDCYVPSRYSERTADALDLRASTLDSALGFCLPAFVLCQLD